MAVLSSLSLLVFLILSPFCFFSFSGPTQINQVVSHPSQPLTITAHDDRGIRFLDSRTGKSVHSMVAHPDAVTCLAVDPSGVFLM